MPIYYLVPNDSEIISAKVVSCTTIVNISNK